jgi:hypothetical protein
LPGRYIVAEPAGIRRLSTVVQVWFATFSACTATPAAPNEPASRTRPSGNTKLAAIHSSGRFARIEGAIFIEGDGPADRPGPGLGVVDRGSVADARHDLEPVVLRARDQAATTATGAQPFVRATRCDTDAAASWA